MNANYTQVLFSTLYLSCNGGTVIDIDFRETGMKDYSNRQENQMAQETERTFALFFQNYNRMTMLILV
jgi:beta-mannanase